MAPARHSTDVSSTTSTELASPTLSSVSSLAVSNIITSPTIIPTPTPTPIITPSVFVQPTVSPVIAQPASSTTAVQEAAGSSHIGLIIGVVVAVLGVLVILFLGVTYLLKRKWSQVQTPALIPRSGGSYAAAPSHDPDDEGARFKQVERHRSTDDDERTLYGGSGRRPSQASKRSSNDYKLSHQRAKASLGTSYAPGIELEDAYAMFGSSSTEVNKVEDARPTYQERHLSQSSMSGGLPQSTRRRSSSLLEDSRYPPIGPNDSLGRRAGRQSVSIGGYQDLFSDAQPPTSPPIPRKTSVGANAQGQAIPMPRSASPDTTEG